MSTIPGLTPAELKSELDAGEKIFLVDVREPHELEISSLPGIIHIPLGEVGDRFAEIPKEENIVVICRSGKRSAQAAEFLLGHGYERVRNMETGMNGWASTVDPNMNTY